MKDHDIDPNESGARNPYRILLHQLTGSSLQRPRQRPAFNLWRKAHTADIEKEVGRRVQEGGSNPKKKAPLREKVVKELFTALPDDEQQEGERIAAEEHKEAVAKFELESKSPPSTKPEDRQR